MKKIHFTSLGCPRNWVDTEEMITLLFEKGYGYAKREEEADFLLVNTCGFLQKAREESLQVIQDLLEKKQKKARVIVTGCMVQKHQHLLEEKFSDQIDLYIGPGHIDQIVAFLEKLPQNRYIISDKKSFLSSRVDRVVATPAHYAYVKIAEGCSKSCSYCIIPKIKGPLQSKKEEQILLECKSLLAKGVKELIFIAQDLTDFGKDRKEQNALCQLLKTLLLQKEKFWLRLLYIYPDDLPDELLSIMASDPRVCPYIDLPIQHVSDPILQAMKRKTSYEKIVEAILKIRKKLPSISIRSSFIVGFPSETDKDFAKLVDFVEEFALDQVGVFTYSREKLSSSYSLKNQIPQKVKEQRAKILLATQQKIVQKKNQKMIGSVVPVIVDSYHPESNLLALARTQKQAPEIDNRIIINDVSSLESFGQIVPVKITAISQLDLIGQIQK